MESRVPNLSKSQDLRDEFHYLLKCSFMSDIKKNCINIFFRNVNTFVLNIPNYIILLIYLNYHKLFKKYVYILKEICQ